MKNYKVDQKKRVVIAYKQSLSEIERKDLDDYRVMGYRIDLLDRKTPRKNTKASRKDLLYYLDNGVISKAIYEELKKHIENKENILIIKSWLNRELMEEAERNKNNEFLDVEKYITTKKTEEEEQQKAKAKIFKKKINLSKFMKDTEKK